MSYFGSFVLHGKEPNNQFENRFSSIVSLSYLWRNPNLLHLTAANECIWPSIPTKIDTRARDATRTRLETLTCIALESKSKAATLIDPPIKIEL